MCGIFGMFGPEAETLGIRNLRKMAYALVHRGPDNYGEWTDGQAFLGHVRLSIIDLESGTQPMLSMGGEVVVIFNGEIYNYRDIWRELSAKGHRFQTDHSDTEVIVNGYLEWGHEIFSKLNGMFAVAIYDTRRKKLVLARDRMGIKPLYYGFYQDNTIVWASEPKAIIASRAIPFSINSLGLPYYLLARSPGPNVTLYENIFALAPGSFAEFDTDKHVIVRKYWELKANEPDSSLGCKELEEKIRQILSKSVLMETISDVPLGLFLSGGVDSSLIAHCLKDHDQIEAYTVGTNSALDESKIALAVCEHLGVKNRTLFVKGDNFFDKFDDWMFYNDDPVANPSALALMLVAEFARSDGKKVMLSGDGADELFGGYESYLKYKWISKIWWMTRILLPKGLIRKLPLPGGLQAIDYLSHKEIKTFLGTAHITDKALRGSLLNKVNDNASNIFEDLDGQLAGGRLIRTALLIDQATRLPCDLLMTTDRATMAVSLETRVPYLNQIMVDAANRLPDAACVSNFKTKVLLKRVASTVLPHDSVYRPKMGFDLPVEIWLKNEFRDQLYSFAGEKKIDFINYDGFMILIDNFMKDEKKTGWHSPIVWALLVLETWYRNWSRPTFERPLNDYVRNGLALQKINSLMELN